LGQNGPGLLGWALKTMYYWYKTVFFYETPEDKYEAETRITYFFRFFKIKPSLCGVKSQLA
jgi:phosphate starvation-inducible membrane PsiE